MAATIALNAGQVTPETPISVVARIAAGTVSEDGRQVSYYWDFPYFEPRKCVDPPWAHFKTEFLRFHRPLSDYWKAFAAAGFAVVGFEEPRLAEDRDHLAENRKKLRNSKTRPYSVAFKLRRPPSTRA